MVFSTNILSKNKSFDESDNSSSENHSSNSKREDAEFLEAQMMDRVGKLAGQLTEHLREVGSLQEGVQTNITINNFNINRVVNPVSGRARSKAKGQQANREKRARNLKKRGDLEVLAGNKKDEGKLSNKKRVKEAGAKGKAEVCPSQPIAEEVAEKKKSVKGKENFFQNLNEEKTKQVAEATLQKQENPIKQTPLRKKKPISLNTAYKVLKKHIEKLKGNLIIHFRESIEREFLNLEDPRASSPHQIISKSNKPSEVIIKFHSSRARPTSSLKTAPKTEDPKKLGRSARANNHQSIIDQMDQQTKLEKLEITFLSYVEKVFDKISHNAEMGLFVFFSDYLRVLRKNVMKVLKKFSQLRRSQVIRILAADLRKTRSKYLEQKLIEWEKLSEHLKDYKIKAKHYPRSHLQNRVYEEVKQYRVSAAVLDSLSGCRELKKVKKKYQIQSLLRSDKLPDCQKPDCVCATETLENFCKFEPVKSCWSSSCPNVQKRVECDEHSKCRGDCHNSFLRKRQYQRLDREVSLRQCWGIDFYSRKNLFHLLPSELSHDHRALIIDNIVRELNFQGHNGWNLVKSARKTQRDIQLRLASLRGSSPVIGHSAVGGNLQDFLANGEMPAKDLLQEVEILARGVEVLIKQLSIKQLRECVRAFSKGLGVVCVKPQGIAKNSLIVRYFGEVYPPWYWYLKQDAIKSFLSKLKKGHCRKLTQYRSNYNMEFYNIFLEKHRDEPGGTELLVIDPIIKGNYASRLSHSCQPNCMTLPVVSEKQYSIGTRSVYILPYIHPLGPSKSKECTRRSASGSATS